MNIALIQTSSLRLGLHHFAHLRAVAEGVPVVDAAKRFLAIEHGGEAQLAHRLVVDRVAAVARRRGDPRWRLVAIEIRAPVSTAPSLQEWAAAEGLDGWSEAELQEMHVERFAADPAERRRVARNARLRERRIALLRELETLSAEKPQSTDRLDGWLPGELAEQLMRGGDLTLGDLERRIVRGGRWWVGLRAYGPRKAARLAGHLAVLLGDAGQRAALARRWSGADESAALAGLAGQPPAGSAIEARNDREAVRAWIAARSGSLLTAKSYEREAERMLLWSVLERGKALSSVSAEDCRAYMDFLEVIPDSWISRSKVARLQPGWAPFKGQLSLASRQLAITVLNSLFEWLVSARYLQANPWVLVNRKLGDDPEKAGDLSSRAFTPVAWKALHRSLDQALPTMSSARLRWLCVFVEATGPRAAEILRATRSHLVSTEAGWLLKVHGKGRRNRTVPVPSTAIGATREYFRLRGLDLDVAAGDVPLFASVLDSGAPVSYGALRQTFAAFVRRALASSDLSIEERRKAEKASAHWLRHTHATRAAERNMPPDVLQENLGQSDPRMTAHYYRAQIERRQRESERVFGNPSG